MKITRRQLRYIIKEAVDEAELESAIDSALEALGIDKQSPLIRTALEKAFKDKVKEQPDLVKQFLVAVKKGSDAVSDFIDSVFPEVGEKIK